MIGRQARRRFVGDNRGVSVVVGAILIFGFLMLTLAVYQVQIVPEQNAQAEFEHFEDSQNELIELREAILTAGTNGVTQFPSLTLGTTYQPRLLAVNPPPPTGTIQTSNPYNITIENNDGEHANVTTRFLEYQPGYNEHRIGTTRFEHSVLYLDERDRGNNVSIIEDQTIVDDGTVTVTALQNEFQQTGTERATLELYPLVDVDASDFPDPSGENFTVRVPTRLDEDDYWDEALEDTNGIYQGVDSQAHDTDTHALNLSVDEDDFEINTIGIRQEPDEDPARNTDREDVPDEFELTITNDDGSNAEESEIEVTVSENDERTVGSGETETFTIGSGEQIDLTAIPQGGGANFDEWSGDIGNEDEASQEITVTMNQDREITGTFVQGGGNGGGDPPGQNGDPSGQT